MAARLAGATDPPGVAKAVAANLAAIGDNAQFMKTDVAFHLAIAVIPCNPIYLAQHEAIAEWLVDRRIVSPRHPGIDRLAYQLHRRIYEATKARDSKATATAMRPYLGQIADRYWK